MAARERNGVSFVDGGLAKDKKDGTGKQLMGRGTLLAAAAHRRPAHPSPQLRINSPRIRRASTPRRRRSEASRRCRASRPRRSLEDLAPHPVCCRSTRGGLSSGEFLLAVGAHAGMVVWRGILAFLISAAIVAGFTVATSGPLLSDSVFQPSAGSAGRSLSMVRSPLLSC
ncbi:hypothetical protein BS78_10G209100 [Paspalum vaginatum]|nr:hypothetical protein BS78_10G209100 [Paspalum vaginatum]